MKKEYITLSLSELKPYEKNPRKNDKAAEMVQKSIKQVGYISPIIIDEENTVLAGHTRLKALKALKTEKIEVVKVIGLTEEQKRKFRFLDNKTNELAEWDFDLLSEELKGLDFGDIDLALDNFTLEKKEIIEDEPPEVDEESEPITKLGDIWQLGRHRLICGDSTDKATVERLMDGKKADMVFTDPPYNVDYSSKNAFLNEADKGNRIQKDIAGDFGYTDEECGEKLWKPAFQNMRDNAKDCCSIYVTMPQGGAHMMMMMMMCGKLASETRAYMGKK